MNLNKANYDPDSIVLAKLNGALRREVLTLPIKINQKEKFTQHINSIAWHFKIMIIVSDMENLNDGSIKMNVFSACDKGKIENLFKSMEIDCRQYRTGVSKLSEIIGYIATYQYILLISNHPKGKWRFKAGKYRNSNMDFNMIKNILEEAYK